MRRILAQGQVSSALIVIGLVGAQQIPQMAFAKDDNVTNAVACHIGKEWNERTRSGCCACSERAANGQTTLL